MGRMIEEQAVIECLTKDNKQLKAYITMMQVDYNLRLKAEKVAMLEEISLKFDEQYYINRHQLHDDSLNRGLEQGQDIIQEKIKALKEKEDE